MIRDCIVHTWFIDLNPSGRSLERLQSVLSSEELTRVQTSYSPEHCRRSMVALAQRRIVLSRYLDVAPEEIRYSLGPYGKPYVAGSKWHFNMSHSHEIAVLALCEETEAGVDIELRRPRKNLEGLVNKVFSRREKQDFQKLPTSQRLASFHKTWTSKEAFVKAIGRGLVYPLSGIEVEVDPTKRSRLYKAEHDFDVENFVIRSLDVSPGYSAHLVVAAQNLYVRVNMPTEADSYSFRQTQSCC